MNSYLCRQQFIEEVTIGSRPIKSRCGRKKTRRSLPTHRLLTVYSPLYSAEDMTSDIYKVDIQFATVTLPSSTLSSPRGDATDPSSFAGILSCHRFCGVTSSPTTEATSSSAADKCRRIVTKRICAFAFGSRTNRVPREA